MELCFKLESNGCLYRVECLHNVPELLRECCDLINLEWKRSLTARMRSIEGSSENFPMSLVVLNDSGKPVGHCKISKISMSHTRVFVETVVIHPDLRGKGLGRFLMTAVEKICRSKSVQWIYLATKGQELFYSKLGYTECAPISIYGCQFNDSTEDINKEEQKKLNLIPSNNFNNIQNCFPPPPPPLPSKSSKPLITNISSVKTFMRKKLF